MQISKVYEPNAVRAFKEKQEAHRAGEGPPPGKPPAPVHLVIHTAPATQHFTPRFVASGLAAGFLSMANGRLTLKTAADRPDVIYTIDSAPGVYCCHCGEQAANQGEARQHLVSSHAGKLSPDQNNPAGYRVDGFYRATKVEK